MTRQEFTVTILLVLALVLGAAVRSWRRQAPSGHGGFPPAAVDNVLKRGAVAP